MGSGMMNHCVRSWQAHTPWTGAPGSHQRTWAENGFFKCFHSTRKETLTHNAQSFARVAVALDGATPRLFRPMYARANMGHPSRGVGLMVRSKNSSNDAPPGLASEARPHKIRFG
jgi:hypothetical protein